MVQPYRKISGRPACFLVGEAKLVAEEEDERVGEHEVGVTFEILEEENEPKLAGAPPDFGSAEIIHFHRNVRGESLPFSTRYTITIVYFSACTSSILPRSLHSGHLRCPPQ